MPTPVMLGLLILSFFLPQLAALGVTALIKNAVAAMIFGALTFLVLACAHAGFAYYTATVEPNWWGGPNGIVPLLYVPAVIAAIAMTPVMLMLYDEKR